MWLDANSCHILVHSGIHYVTEDKDAPTVGLSLKAREILNQLLTNAYFLSKVWVFFT